MLSLIAAIMIGQVPCCGLEPDRRTGAGPVRLGPAPVRLGPVAIPKRLPLGPIFPRQTAEPPRAVKLPIIQNGDEPDLYSANLAVTVNTGPVMIVDAFRVEVVIERPRLPAMPATPTSHPQMPIWVQPPSYISDSVFCVLPPNTQALYIGFRTVRFSSSMTPLERAFGSSD